MFVITIVDDEGRKGKKNLKNQKINNIKKICVGHAGKKIILDNSVRIFSFQRFLISDTQTVYIRCILCSSTSI